MVQFLPEPIAVWVMSQVRRVCMSGVDDRSWTMTYIQTELMYKVVFLSTYTIVYVVLLR